MAAFAASWWFMRPGHGMNCNNLAPLVVLATLAAFLMAVCFRQMSRHPNYTQRWFLVGCLLIAAVTLFTDFRYVRSYRGVCTSFQQQMQPGK